MVSRPPTVMVTTTKSAPASASSRLPRVSMVKSAPVAVMTLRP